jgi:hypothetical protein
LRYVGPEGPGATPPLLAKTVGKVSSVSLLLSFFLPPFRLSDADKRSASFRWDCEVSEGSTSSRSFLAELARAVEGATAAGAEELRGEHREELVEEGEGEEEEETQVGVGQLRCLAAVDGWERKEGREVGEEVGEVEVKEVEEEPRLRALYILLRGFYIDGSARDRSAWKWMERQ